jgi:hypothetical protein
MARHGESRTGDPATDSTDALPAAIPPHDSAVAVGRDTPPTVAVGRDTPPTVAAHRAKRPLVAAVRYCLLVFVIARAGLFVLGAVAVAVLPANTPATVPGWPAPAVRHGWSVVFTAWERWDALWYLRIASRGYAPHDGSAAFFPGYPLLVRDAGWLIGNHLLAGAYVVSSIALVIGLVVVYRLTEVEYDTDLARRTVALLCVFPTSFFFFAPYSESLFLALSAGALLSARRRNWPLATVLAAGATATRSVGVVVVAAIAVESARQLIVGRRATAGGQRRRQVTTGICRTLAVTVGSLAGVAGYLGWWWATAGSPTLPFDAEGGWQRRLQWPWVTLWQGLHEGLRWIGVYAGGYQLIDLLIVAVVLIAAGWALARTPLMFRVYTLGSVAAPLCLVFSGRPFMSMPRFALVVVPLFWALAALSRRFHASGAVIATSAAGLGVCGLLFVNWYWIF